MGYSPFYFIEQTFKNIVRGKGMDFISVLVLVACLLVTGSFYAVNENVNYNLESLGALNKIVVYIEEERTDSEIRQIKSEVEELENVENVTLISKEQALQDEMDRLGEEYADIFEWLEEGENPYRASLEIEYENPEGAAELEKRLAKVEGVENVQSRADTANKVVELKTITATRSAATMRLKVFFIYFASSYFFCFFFITTAITAKTTTIAAAAAITIFKSRFSVFCTAEIIFVPAL